MSHETFAPKTAAQRQASRKARLQAAGLVRFSRWVHADDLQALRQVADKLDELRTMIAAYQGMVREMCKVAGCEGENSLGVLEHLRKLAQWETK